MIVEFFVDGDRIGSMAREVKENDDLEMENMRPILDDLPILASNGLTCTSLFSGGGLLDLGFDWAGYHIDYAIDNDKHAVSAYRHNFPYGYIVHDDITKVDIASIPDSDIIIGGPPCQDYSTAGLVAGEHGDRGKLVWRYLEIIQAKQPRAFLFENVKGLISQKHRLTFDALIQRFDEIGYTVSWRLLNAWDYGIAQKRERVFIVGIRKDINNTYQFPLPVSYKPTLRDAIGDLPEPDTYDANHYRKEISDKALAGYERRGGLGAFGYRVNSWDDPSPTIMGRIFNEGKAFVHPITQPQPRRFTVRECLRIQSVPDSYTLPNNMGLAAMYKVVGNGVPSRLAYYLAVNLADCVLTHDTVHSIMTSRDNA